MILIEHLGRRLLVESADGYDGATVLAANVTAPPPFVTAGDLLDDGSVPLDMLKAEKWEHVKALRDQHKAAGVTVPNVGRIQTDDVSSQNITGLVVMAQVAIANSQPYSEPFTLADNSVVALDAPGMISMGVAVGRYVAAVYARGRALRDAIEAATNAASLDAIDISSGWPQT